jgi:putative ABC transport system ATP-binding protein
LLNITRVFKCYGEQQVLADVTLQVAAGELCAIIGPSGSGKSTLMNLVGLLDRPSSGSIAIDGEIVEALSGATAASLRNRLIGFVFQNFELLPRLSALQNVALPLFYRGIGKSKRERQAAAMLHLVGLGDRLSFNPRALSGGQRQRVAIARALVGEPKLLLADEPTGSLDSESSEMIMDLFVALNRDAGLTTMIITHDLHVAARCDRQIEVLDGRIVHDSAQRHNIEGGSR